MKEEYREQVLLSSLLNWKLGDERTEADLIRILPKLIKLKSNFIFKLQTLVIFWSKFSYISIKAHQKISKLVVRKSNIVSLLST